MEYGQGKDVLANFRRQNNYGAGLNTLIRMGGHAVGTLGALVGGAKEVAAESGLKLLGEVKNLGSQLLNSKKTNTSAHPNTYNVGLQSPINLTTPALEAALPQLPNYTQQMNNTSQTIGNPLLKYVTPQLNVAGLAFDNSGYDTGAGYNPKSGTFRDGQGNVIADDKPTFEEQVAHQTVSQLDPRLTENKGIPSVGGGKKINYLKFFS